MNRFAIREIWRYPVKSMAGERLDGCAVTADGLLGDRCWALRDEERACIADARKLPAMLDIHVRYARPPEPTVPRGRSAGVELRLPGAESGPVASDDPAVHDVLSAHLGRKVTLWPLLSAQEDRAHYVRAWPEDVERYLKDLFGVADLAEMPDLSALPPEVAEYQTMPGTYFDAYPVHLVTTGELAALARAEPPPPDVDSRRFRPNLLLEGPAAPDWVGRRVRIGSAVLRVEADCPRCVMVSQPQQGLPAARGLLRTVHRDFGHQVGLYASVERPGRVECTDVAEVEDAEEE
ncbi:MOSC N-terminal beta barrel domain-containing protein [Streptomyces niveus]|uniref:MOSC domain-containing protein n=1 Tax=Streptomyces niveus TaxID=193462 RepID=UPI003442ABB3|nr:MOSC N-terminal beta barrel domain-containing protein [Streptomyces niveus]